MKRVRLATITICFFALIVPVSTLFLPAPTDSTLSALEQRITLALLSLLAWLHIGAAILFLLGLKEFKQRLKNAYFLICSGLVIMGLNMVQLPVLGIFNLWEAPWILYGGLSFPYTLGLLLAFLGMRRFGDSLRIKSWLMSLLNTLYPAIGLGVIGGFLLGNDSFNIDFGARLMNCALIIFVTLLVLKVKKTAGPAYSEALAWLFLAFASVAIGQIGVVLFDLMHTDQSPLVVVPYALASAFFVKSGYAFNKISEF